MASGSRATVRSTNDLTTEAIAQRIVAMLGSAAGEAHIYAGGSRNVMLTLDEAAARARLSTRTLRRALRAGRLRASQPSGPWWQVADRAG